MCKCPGGNACISTHASLSAVAIVFVFFGALNMRLPWLMAKSEHSIGNFGGYGNREAPQGWAVLEMKTSFSFYGYGSQVGDSDWDHDGYDKICDNAQGEMDKFCGKILPSFIMTILGFVFGLVSSITACVQGCCKTQGSKCCVCTSVGFIVPAALFILLGTAVFASGKTNLEDQATENTTVSLHIAFYTALLALILAVVSTPFAIWGLISLKPEPAYPGVGGGPTVVGQVVGNK